MITVISPAKTLDLESGIEPKIVTNPVFGDEPERIIRKLRTLSRKKIGNLMSISEKLSDLNYQRYQDWSAEPNSDQLFPAMYMFKGEVYLGLDAATFSEEDQNRAQNQLRILSGLYGYLKPMDRVQPYRLEMGTKLPIARKKNLYDFWGEKIAKEIKSELSTHEHPVLVNLASNEYFKAAQVKKIGCEVITPVFKDAKNGEFKMISFFAKKARGLMAGWMIRNDIQDPKDLIKFNEEGYSYNERFSTDKEMVFTRG